MCIVYINIFLCFRNQQKIEIIITTINYFILYFVISLQWQRVHDHNQKVYLPTVFIRNDRKAIT